jgi:hypothetical protein
MKPGEAQRDIPGALLKGRRRPILAALCHDDWPRLSVMGSDKMQDKFAPFFGQSLKTVVSFCKRQRTKFVPVPIERLLVNRPEGFGKWSVYSISLGIAWRLESTLPVVRIFSLVMRQCRNCKRLDCFRS